MDKQTLLQELQSSSVSDALKKELMAMVEAESDVTPELMAKIHEKIENHIDQAAEQIMLLGVEDATAKFNAEMDGIEEDGTKLVADVYTQADEIDLAAAKEGIENHS